MSHWSKWRTSVCGYVLSALGLASGGFGVARLLAAWAGRPASFTIVATTLVTGLLVSATGFCLLVVGSDPFRDTDR